MKCSVLQRAILLSFLLHGLVLLAFLRAHSLRAPETLHEQTIQVDLTEFSETAALQKSPTPANNLSAHTGSSHFSWKHFASGGWVPGPSLKASPARSLSPDDPFYDWSPSVSGESAVRGKSISAIAWVYRKTKQVLTYPPEFRKHEIQGDVEARFAFDLQGKIVPASLFVKSNSPYLRVYIYRLIERIFLHDPIPAQLRNWDKTLEIICDVRFRFVEHNAAVDLIAPVPIAGNRIYFAKTNVHSKLQWQLGPLSGLYPLPIFGLDLLWFVDQAKQVVDDKAPVDDLALYKNDPLFYN